MAIKLKVPTHIILLVQDLERQGYQAHVVGGAVRDALLGQEPHDWDIATDATPEQMREVFPRIIPTGEKFGTMTVLMGDTKTEVTTYRAEGRYVDGRRPSHVHFARTIQEDLSRRDFTINAMAYNPVSQELIDPYLGYEDIKDPTIRFVGVPRERIAEDSLRILRAIRFLLRIPGAHMCLTTMDAISQFAPLVARVAQERITNEITRMLTGPDGEYTLESLSRYGLLPYTFPLHEMQKEALGQGAYHKYRLWEHTLIATRVALSVHKGDLTTALAAIFHDVGKPLCRTNTGGEIHYYDHHLVGAELTFGELTRMKFPGQLVQDVTSLVQEHMFPLDMGKPAIRRLKERMGTPEQFGRLVTLKQADMEATGFDHKAELDEFLGKVFTLESEPKLKLAVTGRDIMDILGLKEGKQVGEVKDKLIELVLDNPTCNTREHLLWVLRGIHDKKVDAERPVKFFEEAL